MSGMDGVESVSFSAGDYLFYENDKSFHFFIIEEGQVEVFKMRKDGAKITLAMVGPGTSLGEFAMIDKSARSATARAVTDVRAARISEQAYQQLLQELPEWATSVMVSLIERLRNTNDLIRKHGIVNGEALNSIESFQTEASTITVTDPYLKNPDDDDDPDLA